MTVEFNVTATERDLLKKLSARWFEGGDTLDQARRYLGRTDSPETRKELEMDLAAVHCNACRLDLPGLLSSAPLDFAHDVGLIPLYLDRKTGGLTGLFEPRFAQRKERS